MQAIDTFKAGKSAGLGLLLSAANPKNLFWPQERRANARTGASTDYQAVELAVSS
jgi:hypothetical protein